MNDWLMFVSICVTVKLDCFSEVCPVVLTNRLQKDGSSDGTSSSEQLGVHMKGEEEHDGMHVKGESTESELDEEEEDEDVIQLTEGDEEERGGYTQVGVRMYHFSCRN